MPEEMKFFMYLLEYYASYRGKKTGDVLKEWDEKGITQAVYDNYWGYHTERIENAFIDIDSLLATGKHAWQSGNYDWEQRKLGATNTFFTDGNYGEAYPKSSDMTDSGSGIPFLTGGNLKDGKLSLDGASYITPEKHSKLTSGHLLEDDIVIAVRGSLGALGYVNTDNSGWNINSQLAILRTDKSELYGKFLIQYLLSWTGQNELLKRQTGSALKQLPIGAIKDVEVPITSIAEQGKIGEYFSNLDNLITLHQRKLEKLQNIKKAMLEKMFVQKNMYLQRGTMLRYEWELSVQFSLLSREKQVKKEGVCYDFIPRK